MISVIIATRNRAEALRDISLPSLLLQDCDDFEVIVWDASDDERPRFVVETFIPKFSERGVSLRFYKAPRVGLTSQRNDSLKVANGEFIFFIDDDSEVSSDGLSVLSEAFRDNPKVCGIGLPLEDSCERDVTPKPFWRISVLRLCFILANFLGKPSRMIFPSGWCVDFSPLSKIISGKAEYLSGCDMAFKKDVFNDLKFEERLQNFSGYALWEDVDFSHRVMLRYSEPLLLAANGLIKHHGSPGGRNDGASMQASVLFNRFILRQNFGMGNVNNYLMFLWTCFSRFCIMLSRPSCLGEFFKGARMAHGAIVKICGMALGKNRKERY